MLLTGLSEVAKAHQVPFYAHGEGGMFGFFFTNADTVTSFQQATECDADKFKRFFHLMLEEGIYLAPSSFEAGFLSTAHSQADIDATIAAADRCFAKL